MAPKRGSGSTSRSRAPRARAARLVTTCAAALAVTTGLMVTADPRDYADAPDLVSTAQQWTALHDGPQPYPDVRVEDDVAITVSDGVVLKASVYRPVDDAGAPATTPLPTLVTMTPYTKLMAALVDAATTMPALRPLTVDLARRINLSGTPISGFEDLLDGIEGGTVQTMLGLDRALVRSGYNLVMVDVRGTGISQGSWETLGPREQLDTREVIEWAATQPWSNGVVGMTGGSYAAINQLRAAEEAPAALRAIFPVEPGSDLMRDVVAPGGGIGVTFLPLWLNSVNQSKMVPDVADLLRGEVDWTWLHERLADPMTNVDLLTQSLTARSLDDLPPALEAALDESSEFRQGILGHPERITVPTFLYGGWHDIFANSATTVYNAIPLPATAVPPPPAPDPGSTGTQGPGTEAPVGPAPEPAPAAPVAPAPATTTPRPLVSNVVGGPAARPIGAPLAVAGQARQPAGQPMKKLVIGDTYHANPGAGTGVPGAPPRLDVLQRAWMDYWLKGIDNGIDGFGPVTVWEQGGGWTTLPQFPQPGVTHRRVHLRAEPSGTADSVHDGSLSAEPPTESATLTVSPGLSTLCSRDAAQGSAGLLGFLDICAKDSRIAERNALTFTAAPVEAPTVISGPINVHLRTLHDAADGYWNVTVNDVAPDGTSTVLSTGQLTASMRAIDESRSVRSANGDLIAPYNPITRDSHLPVTPGVPVALDIAVIPTQAILSPGHRLRVDVFAGNAPKALAFRPMLDQSQLRPQHLVLDPSAPSFVNLPTDRPL